ncbi:MAG: hypothetical protein HKN93_06745, partial [Acidimicrobiia bacterium]|nr:hypothetical protein [Acidimicrobiia bacterium]
VVDVPRRDVLLAWDIKTQTIKEPLDREVEGSLANTLPSVPLFGAAGPGMGGMNVIAAAGGGTTPTDIFNSVNPSICPATGACGTVGQIYAGAFVAPNYQIDTPNPADGGDPVPGPWSAPLRPDKVGDAVISVTAFTPNTAIIEKPAGGWPVIIFGHGITRSRLDVFAVASQLTASGFAVITHDWVAHGDPRSPLGAGRAVQIDFDSPQCQGQPDPTDRDTGGITCYGGFFSSDLAASRDNFRQSALDTMSLVNSLETCTGGACGGDFDVDSARVGFLGQSLGGIIGTIVVAMSPDIKAAVFNVTGVGLSDVIESTQSKLLQCPLIDALILAGVIDGDLSDPGSGTGTCFGDDWKTDPRWVAFANTARWILDPADGVNYVDRLVGRAVFVQEVDEDETVPNVSTANLVQLLGTTAIEAAVYTGTPMPPNPTGAVLSGSRGPLHLRYLTVDTPAPNTYGHGSLLAPPGDSGAAGQLGTAQMQTDAITYLILSL